MQQLEEFSKDKSQQLKEGVELLQETQATYEERLAECESQMQMHVQDLNFQLEQNKILDRQVSDLKNELRKYEYEVEMLTETQH